jgi:hypothetical protein|tara:strand:+ start:592 stop:1014 length:423 start_codon:yes stop_codon:yes gene_type:complete
MANNGKGIGPNRLGASKGSVTSPAKQTMVSGENMTASETKKMKDNSVFGPNGKNVAPAPGERKKMVKGKNSPKNKKTNFVSVPEKFKNQEEKYPTPKSPAKKNKGMSYDIKEASNQSLSKSARKHYAENAQAANKSGYKG